MKEHANAKLTPDQVGLIRRRLAGGATHETLAAEFGVGVSTVRAISAGRSWNDVRDFGPGGVCDRCARPLSRYNPDPRCGTCSYVEPVGMTVREALAL